MSIAAQYQPLAAKCAPNPSANPDRDIIVEMASFIKDRTAMASACTWEDLQQRFTPAEIAKNAESARRMARSQWLNQ